MIDDIDYARCSDFELVEMFGRIDPMRAPANCARVKRLLIDRGYLVHENGQEPGYAVPGPEKLRALIGADHPIGWKVIFDETYGIFGCLEPRHNDFGLVGCGTVEADGLYLRLVGRRSRLPGVSNVLPSRETVLQWRHIANVETSGAFIYLVYRVPQENEREVTFRLPDPSAATRLAGILPSVRTANFVPQIEARLELERHLITESPTAPVTAALVALNVLMLMVTALSGKSLTAWGSDFGPYTSDGDWWRLLTALFLHAGLLHVVLNMWGLASFGPAAERLFGSVNYLLLYLVSGVAGNLASIAWHPDVNGVGASGAIMGVLGSLLAAQWRIENKVLRSVLRPLRNSVLLFAAYALVTGFIHANIDNAAHLGGFAAGILTGLAVARPITGERVYGRRDVLALLRLVPVAMLILSAGFWYARHKAATLSGDGLYWSTVHWLRGGEHATVQKFNSALALESNNRDLTALANAVDNDVLPFWREASNRLSSIHLTADSQNISGLELLQLLSDGRIKAFEHLSKAARANDGLQVSAAELELKQVETGAFARHKAEQ